MSRMIDAYALIAEMHNVILEDGEDRRTFYEVIERQPTIEERKTGKWEIYVISPFDGEGCQCSECKYEGAPYWNFCANCGAKMSGGEEG